MNDPTTHGRLTVLDYETGPSVRLPMSRLEEVKAILDRNDIVGFWADPVSVSIDGEPAQITVNFGRMNGVRAAGVQPLLDAID